MLKRVFLYLKKSEKDTRFNTRRKDAEKLLGRLRMHSIAGRIMLYDNIICHNSGQPGLELTMENPEFGAQPEKQDEKLLSGALCIVDDSFLCRRFARDGIPVVAFLHAGNRNQDFSEIPYALEEIGNQECEYLERIYRRLKGIPWKIFETARCLVREITEADVDGLYEIYREPSITAYMENLYADREKEREYTQQYIKGIYGFYEYGMWVVIDKRDGKLIGRVGIENQEESGLELGYVIAKPYQRQGFATEVCLATLHYAAEVLDEKEIYSRIEKENIPSIYFIRKLGFYLESEKEVEGRIFQIYKRCMH